MAVLYLYLYVYVPGSLKYIPTFTWHYQTRFKNLLKELYSDWLRDNKHLHKVSIPKVPV